MQKSAFLATLVLASTAFAQPPAVTNNNPSMPQNGQMTIEQTNQNGQEQTTVIDSGGNLKSVDSVAAPGPQQPMQQVPTNSTPGVGAELPQATSPNQPAVPVQQNMPQQGMPAPASGQMPSMNPPPPQGR